MSASVFVTFLKLFALSALALLKVFMMSAAGAVLTRTNIMPKDTIAIFSNVAFNYS